MAAEYRALSKRICCPNAQWVRHSHASTTVSTLQVPGSSQVSVREPAGAAGGPLGQGLTAEKMKAPLAKAGAGWAV